MTIRIFDWMGNDFEMGRQAALHCIDLLERVVKGEKIALQKALQEFLRKEFNEEATMNVIAGLVHIGEMRISFFYRDLGFDARQKTWMAIPQTDALQKLDDERARIQQLAAPVEFDVDSQKGKAPTLKRVKKKKVRRSRKPPTLPQGYTEPRVAEKYIRVTHAQSRVVTPRHIELVNAFSEWLSTQGYGSKFEAGLIDLSFVVGSLCCMTEAKVTYGTSMTRSIREALGQVVEYNLYPGRRMFDRWLIVLDGAPTDEDIEFIRRIRSEMGIPLYLGWKQDACFIFETEFESIIAVSN